MPIKELALESLSEREQWNVVAQLIPAPLRIIDEQEPDHLLLVWLGPDLSVMRFGHERPMNRGIPPTDWVNLKGRMGAALRRLHDYLTTEVRLYAPQIAEWNAQPAHPDTNWQKHDHRKRVAADMSEWAMRRMRAKI